MSNLEENNPSNKVHYSVQIDSTSIIENGASIGQNTKIWHWVHVCKEAVIGANCSLGQNVFISNKVSIGSNVKIQNNVSIYDNISLEDDVFCGPSVVFTNVKNPRSRISRKNEYQSTVVKKGVSLGANCTVICGITIGEHAFVAAGAVVTKDVKPFALVQGIPAKQVGWISEFGEKIPLPLKGKGDWLCEKEKKKYYLKGSEIVAAKAL